jgi:hypothetical protein
MKSHYAAALGRYDFVRGKIDFEIVILIVVSGFVLLAPPHCFSNGSLALEG